MEVTGARSLLIEFIFYNSYLLIVIITLWSRFNVLVDFVKLWDCPFYVVFLTQVSTVAKLVYLHQLTKYL